MDENIVREIEETGKVLYFPCRSLYGNYCNSYKR